MLQVEHLTRRYGKVTAVDDLSFEISDDGVYGFLGPNGAGKSTTMNIMTGCLSATSGTVRISGYDIYEQPKEAKRRIGYLPEQPPLYLGETPAEYLRFVGEAKGLRGDALRREIEDAIEETGIGEMRSRRIDALSKGYRQRVGIAQALLGEPEIVILDEPTVGLDPLQILEIRSLISALGRSRTVLISSHILSEVQTMCSKILIIAHGKLVAFDAPEKLEERLAAPGEITITAETDAQRARALVEALPGVAGITVRADGPDRSQLAVASGTEDIYALSQAIFQTFASSGCALCELGVKKPSLEDIFLELTEGGETA
ncbi:ABC transporter ATP-binding protein [Oscillibacter valericigenes]|uniref:ABC transporter ATP-binding protein n=1 Tax=Oscillibacter valericigenes TaxID=351091 RepID=A0ABS2FX82_9FIRM|nr:ABC transporter ATP-binding protein [Oscillibacter valericigenes]MBM6851491.1 ABC transporter ATP-binding protein [Oscillibacter valericigenes]